MCPALISRPRLAAAAALHLGSRSVSLRIMRAEVVILTTDTLEQQHSQQIARHPSINLCSSSRLMSVASSMLMMSHHFHHFIIFIIFIIFHHFHHFHDFFPFALLSASSPPSCLLFCPLLSSLLFSSSPLLFSSLRGLPLSLLCLWSVLLSSFFSVLCSRCFLCCVVAAASAAVLLLCVFLSGGFSFRANFLCHSGHD